MGAYFTDGLDGCPLYVFNNTEKRNIPEYGMKELPSMLW